MKLPSHFDGNVTPHKKLELVHTPEHILERRMKEFDEEDSYQVMHDLLTVAKKNPVLLSSWDMDMTFEEACKKYGVE